MHYLGTHFSVCFDPGLSSRRSAMGRSLQGLGKKEALIGCPANRGGACRQGQRGRPRGAPAPVLPGSLVSRDRKVPGQRDRRPGRDCTGRLGPDSLFSAQLDVLACSADALVAGHLSGRVCDDITVKGLPPSLPASSGGQARAQWGQPRASCQYSF